MHEKETNFVYNLENKNQINNIIAFSPKIPFSY